MMQFRLRIKRKNKAVPISNFEYPCAFHKNGSKIEQDVVTKDFNTAIVFRIFNFLLERISINACFRFILIFSVSVLENLGTILNINKAHTIPRIQRTGILSSPKYWAKAEDNNGPVEKPKVPKAMKTPIFLAELDVVNFETNPKACGW